MANVSDEVRTQVPVYRSPFKASALAVGRKQVRFINVIRPGEPSLTSKNLKITNDVNFLGNNIHREGRVKYSNVSGSNTIYINENPPGNISRRTTGGTVPTVVAINEDLMWRDGDQNLRILIDHMNIDTYATTQLDIKANTVLTGTDISVIDFNHLFTVTESPAGEANIGLYVDVAFGLPQLDSGGRLTQALQHANTAYLNSAPSTGEVFFASSDSELESEPQFHYDSSTKVLKVGNGPSYVGGTLYTNATAVGNVGLGEDDLMGFTMPADTLNVDGQGLEIEAWGTKITTASALTLKAYIGTTAYATITLMGTAGNWYFKSRILRTGSSGQDVLHTIIDDSAVTPVVNTITTAAENLGTARAIKLTAEHGAGTNNAIVQEGIIFKHPNKT